MIDKTLPPTTKDYINLVGGLFSTPLSKGVSILCHVVPKSGVHSLLKYLSSSSSDSQLKELIFVDFLEVQTENEIKNVIQDIQNQNQDASISKNIVLNNFQETFEKENLFALTIKMINELSPLNNFILLYSGEIDSKENYSKILKIGILKEIFIPMKSYEDIIVLQEKEETWYEYTIDQEVKELIARKSGGYSAIARELLNLYNDIGKDSFLELSDFELMKQSKSDIRIYDLLKYLSEESLDILKQYTLSKSNSNIIPTKFLRETKILYRENDKLKVFSPFLRIFIKEELQDKLIVSMNEGKLYRSNIPTSEILGSLESEVFKILYESSGETVSKEEIAKTMWKENWSDQYSDWAIAQIIYSIRKKLLLNKSILSSVRNSGYKLSIEK